MFNGRGFESLKVKSHQHGFNEELTYSVSSMQGWRNEMEDAHCAQIDIKGFEKWSFFGVYDGHGGDLCSKEVSSKCFFSRSLIFGEIPNHRRVKKIKPKVKTSL
jgi:serine/threonine protein phosphatase PrpC